MVDEALLGIGGLHVPDSGFTNRPNLHLLTVGPSEGSGANAAFPIVGFPAELDVAKTGVIQSPQISGNGALHGVPNIVDIKGIAISPAMQRADGIHVPFKERAAGVAGSRFGGVAEGMLN